LNRYSLKSSMSCIVSVYRAQLFKCIVVSYYCFIVVIVVPPEPLLVIVVTRQPGSGVVGDD